MIILDKMEEFDPDKLMSRLEKVCFGLDMNYIDLVSLNFAFFHNP